MANKPIQGHVTILNGKQAANKEYKLHESSIIDGIFFSLDVSQ
jgi:hypothetical protein